MEPIQLPSHEHPLVIDPHLVIICCCCKCTRQMSSEDHYVVSCEICDCYFHFQCVARFLLQINHPSHPDHLLTILEHKLAMSFQFSKNPIECGVCGKSYPPNIPYFECHRCSFYIDLFCALKIPTVIYEKKDNNNLHLCHRKPMRLIEIKHDEEDHEVVVKCCYICELSLSNPAYSCIICHHFFHGSCTQLSSKIRHPIHLRHHDLILKLGGVGKNCHSCHKTCLNFVFQCSNELCRRYICVACTLSTIRSTVRPTIIYQGHDHHLLSLVELPHKIIRCNSPYSYCKQYPSVPHELTHIERYIFCCQSCNFALHLLCGPLPCVIKHNCHIHPLTLLDSMIEDDSGDYYCDACETQRDPRICVYYCAECKYMAHVSCVISEVVSALQGDRIDVELRVVGQMNQKPKLESNEKEEDEAKPTTLLHLFTLLEERLNIKEYQKKGVKEVLKSLIRGWWVGEEEEDNEKKILEAETAAHDVMFSLITRHLDIFGDDQHEEEPGQTDETSIQELNSSCYSENNFKHLVKKLVKDFADSSTWRDVTADELKMKLVKAEGGYMITWNLAHIMKHLFDKFGDISGDEHDQEESSGRELTNLSFFFLCRLLYKMRKVIVVDVTEDDLGDWYSCLKFLKYVGFKVDFINSRLERIVRAYFGLQARRGEIAAKAEREEKTSTLRQEIEELEAKLKRCKEDLETNERHRRHPSDSETTIFMKHCLNEASKFEWKTAADCLDLM